MSGHAVTAVAAEVWWVQALEAQSEGVLALDKNFRIVTANRAAQCLLGYTAEELAGQDMHALLQSRHRDGRPYPESESPLSWLKGGGEIYYIEDVFWRKDGTPCDFEISALSLPQPDREVSVIVLIQEISELKKVQAALIQSFEDRESLNRNLETTQGQLMQSEKMASIGQLAAGVAHEINNPIGFVNSNLGSLKGQVGDLLRVIDAYAQADVVLSAHPELQQAIVAAKRAADLVYLREDIGALIDESLEGVRRVRTIVDNLKDFSRVDTAEWHFACLEKGLESTLSIVWNEIKYKAEVKKEYAGIPEIECIASQLNQVFMNLLINAAQAIEERGVIVLRTGFDDVNVWVEVEDNGKGIQPEHLGKIFEPFFTTKPVGKGTGLGLSLAYGIVQRHHGLLEVRSEAGKGTVFRVTLPRRRSDEGSQAA